MTIDGMFPALSPSGRRLMSGAAQLWLDGQLISPNAISGAWLGEQQLLYRQHSSGDVYRYDLLTGRHEATDVWRCGWVAANRHGLWAVNRPGADGHPEVWASDGRVWSDMGGGMAPVHVADDGAIYFGHHCEGTLFRAQPGRTALEVIDPQGGSWVRSYRGGIVYERQAKVWHRDDSTGEVTCLSFPHQDEFKPIPVEVPGGGVWLITITHTRLLARPLRSVWGLVLDTSGNTFYPDAAWNGDAIRVCWSEGMGWPPPRGTAGTPHETLVDFDAPRVHLPTQPATPPPGDGWVPLPAGTPIDMARFLCGFVSHAREGSPNVTADGQVYTHAYQVDAHRSEGYTQVIKGGQAHGNRSVWVYDDHGVGLSFDVTPEFPQGYALCAVGSDRAAVLYPRQMAVGESVQTPVDVVDLATGTRTRWTFQAELVAAYGPRAIGEMPPLWHATIRYGFDHPRGWDEVNHCVEGYGTWAWVETKKTTGEWRRWEALRFAEPVAPAPVPEAYRRPPVASVIPGPPVPPDTPERPDMPEIRFPPRDETLAFTAALDALYRDELGRGADTALHVDLEGVAVWQQEYLRHRVNGAGHDAAQAATFRSVRQAAGIEAAPDPR